jgi:hypothetical protein
MFFYRVNDDIEGEDSDTTSSHISEEAHVVGVHQSVRIGEEAPPLRRQAQQGFRTAAMVWVLSGTDDDMTQGRPVEC